MKGTKFNIRSFNLFPYRIALKDNTFRKNFFLDITLLNFNRLRIFGYFIIVLAISQLYFDFFQGDFWETYQVNTFMIFDVILLLVAIIVLLVTHINPPNSNESIRHWHKVFIYAFVIFHLLWVAGISITEASSAVSLPTYLIGVFTAATLFILRGMYFLLMLLISFITLVLGLIQQGLTLEAFVTQYAPVVVLVILAWIISRVLFGTRIKYFYANKTLENARNDLDKRVKERTSELRTTNIKLKDEINERKRYEVFLQIEKRKAEEADRLKSVFLANMSHEIRTPLNGLLGFSDLLQNNELTEDKRARYIEIIQNNGEQLLKIIDDIMDISIIESNQLKINRVNFRISQILPDALSYFSNLKASKNKENIDIINHGFENNAIDMVNSDPSRIQQVLYNLLNNALKFTTEGTIEFGGRTDDGYIMLYVEDTGIGLDVALCDTIFERFRQGEESISRAYGGTGLGLSISKGIIELLGGIIWVDFSYMKGARFCFTLPSAEIDPDNQIPIRKELLDILSDKEIVVSNNDPLTNTPLTYFLRCSNSHATCIKPENFAPEELPYEPALIIIDINDPVKVLELTDEISKHLSRTKVMAIFDQAEDYSDQLFEAGCSSVLRNPLNLHVFLLHLKKLIG